MTALGHRPARVGGPQRGPACAQRDEEFVLVAKAEKALELAGKADIRAVLDQRRMTARRRAFFGLPGADHSLFQIGCKIALIKLQTDFDRQPALGRGIRILIGADTIGKAEMAICRR